jgi:actin-related protein
VLFHPDLIGSESLGIHEKIFKTIMNCAIDTRKEFYKNIVLSSGTTMMKGFNKRLNKELISMVPESIKIKTIEKSERMNSVWIGGSILASLTCYKQLWITKEDYIENGKNIIHNKC